MFVACCRREGAAVRGLLRAAALQQASGADGACGGAGEGWIWGGGAPPSSPHLGSLGGGGVFIFLEKEAAGSTPAETPGAGGVHDSRKVANLSLPTAFF